MGNCPHCGGALDPPKVDTTTAAAAPNPLLWVNPAPHAAACAPNGGYVICMMGADGVLRVKQ